MTPLAGFFLALIAGWFAREPKRAAATVVIPYLAVVARCRPGPSRRDSGTTRRNTVTPFSGAISYYVVQLVFGLLAVGIAAELGVLRGRTLALDPRAAGAAGPWQRAAVATAICATATLVLMVAFVVRFAPVAHHTANGGPPLQGLAGMALSLIGFVVLGIAVLSAPPEAGRGRRGVGDSRDR